MNPVTVVRQATRGATGEKIGQRAWVQCPGCGALHSFILANDDGTIPTGPVWTWDGNVESPTFSPSMLVRWGDGEVCHSFVEAGRWRFLDDSTHALAGEVGVPMLPLPDWLAQGDA